jgi:hypothetical protein
MKVGPAKLVVCLSLLLASSAAIAGTSQGYGNGGWFARYDPIVAQHNASGELFRIQGHCQSACTLFLGIRNVCIEPSARLLFHAGHNRNKTITAKATNHLLQAYNVRLRRYLVAGGHMRTLSFHTISGADMIRKFGYRECPTR